MKSNKGFTLIELLAVIVILAIIALIATPTILGVIETARKGSAESSVLGYIDAVEKQIAIDMLEAEKSASGVSGLAGKSGQLAVANGSVDGTAVSLKGTAPKSGYINVNATTGSIDGACVIQVSSGKYYKVTYDGNKAKAVAGDTNTECSSYQS